MPRQAAGRAAQPVAYGSAIQTLPFAPAEPSPELEIGDPDSSLDADALDAITTDRPYRSTRTWEEARIEILQGRGTHFDSTVVDAFLEIFDELHGLSGAEEPFELPGAVD